MNIKFNVNFQQKEKMLIIILKEYKMYEHKHISIEENPFHLSNNF